MSWRRFEVTPVVLLGVFALVLMAIGFVFLFALYHIGLWVLDHFAWFVVHASIILGVIVVIWILGRLMIELIVWKEGNDKYKRRILLDEDEGDDDMNLPPGIDAEDLKDSDGSWKVDVDKLTK